MSSAVAFFGWQSELLKGSGDDEDDLPPISEKEIDEGLDSLSDDGLLDAISADLVVSIYNIF